MRSRLRASQISIESVHPDRDVWIHIVIQQIIYDDNGNVVNIIPSYDRFSKPMSTILTQIYPFIHNSSDVVTGYEVMKIITDVVVEWIKERYNVEADEEGNLWLL